MTIFKYVPGKWLVPVEVIIFLGEIWSRGKSHDFPRFMAAWAGKERIFRLSSVRQHLVIHFESNIEA